MLMVMNIPVSPEGNSPVQSEKGLTHKSRSTQRWECRRQRAIVRIAVLKSHLYTSD